MLSDRFNRKINYLRISVTDRCNHRCMYCMPESGVALKSRILSYEQIEAFAGVAAKLGITKIRLTGGEPLVRKDIDRLVGKLSRIDDIDEVCLTTNGTMLVELATKLKRAGLTRVNISIDSLDPERFAKLTRGGDLDRTLAGVGAAIDAQLGPIKINMVILSDTTESDIARMEDFCRTKDITLQKIMQFSLYDRDDLSDRFHTERPPKCSLCNRIRLTADGFLKPCLFSEDEIRVNFDDIAQSIKQAIGKKIRSGNSCGNRHMSQIGG